MKSAAGLLILAGGLLSCATPAAGTPGVRPITDFAWERGPEALHLARFYPDTAREAGLGGRSVLRCRVQAQALVSCGVAAEEPAGLRFGQQAIRAVADLRLAPLDRQGRSVEGALIELPIIWVSPF